ncbi:hypothetical protein KP509_29G002200 [Ceratopteris richardii]|uniref:Late embryogenesis abundant protein LEA-2 subgroup domain-containing protein n=1 Tax=Ceratopteris richardii TaxID=49495 RepID=A0A8T2R475_CERRI|nr:hypothetical protein KP509_29G002200 [Ceratopteris richardii]
MSENKVHPMLGQVQPSAPPLFADGSSRLDSGTSEKSIYKEQETSLLRDQGQPHRFYPVYGLSIPPSPPARSSHSAASVAKAADRSRISRPRRGNGRGCGCCLVSFVATLVAIALILGVLALVTYLAVRPKAPKFSVAKATLKKFDLNNSTNSDGGAFLLDTDLVLSMQARNLNKKLGFYYDYATVALLYHGERVAESLITAFSQPHRSTTSLSVPLKGRNTSLAPAAGADLQSSLVRDGFVSLRSTLKTRARVKMGLWKSKRYRVKIICDFQLDHARTARAPKDADIAPNTCKVRVRIAHITFTL